MLKSVYILSIIQLFSSCVYLLCILLFIYVQFSCCPLRALNWSVNWFELKLNWIEYSGRKTNKQTNKQTNKENVCSSAISCIPSRAKELELCLKTDILNALFNLILNCLSPIWLLTWTLQFESSSKLPFFTGTKVWTIGPRIRTSKQGPKYYSM